MTYWLFYEKDSALELFPAPSNMEITAFNKHLCIWNYVNVVRSESTFGVIWMNTFPFSYTLYFPFSGIDLLFHSRNFHVEMFDFFFFFLEYSSLAFILLSLVFPPPPATFPVPSRNCFLELSFCTNLNCVSGTAAKVLRHTSLSLLWLDPEPVSGTHAFPVMSGLLQYILQSLPKNGHIGRKLLNHQMSEDAFSLTS